MEYKKDYFGYIYKWVDTTNDMFYIGSHHGDVSDSYVGSGVRFKKAYNKRPDKFRFEVLELISEPCAVENHKQCSMTTCSVLQAEQKYLDQYNVALNESSYNLKQHASGGGTGHNKGRTKDNNDGMARTAAAKIGKTVENNKGRQDTVIKLRAKNKDNNAGVKDRATARTGETKENNTSRATASRKISGTRNYAWCGYVHTDDGVFDTLALACTHFNMTTPGIIYRINADTFPEWYIVKQETFICETPLGKFKTLKEAALKHGLGTSGIVYRLKAATFSTYRYLK